MKVSAIFSIDRKHKYKFFRSWNNIKASFLFTSLNPSVADATAKVIL